MKPFLRAVLRPAAWCSLIVLLALPTAGRAQNTQSRLLATAGGTVAGVAGGGYVALAVIVAEARAGRYLHDLTDVLGWRSLPVVAGAAAGGGLGFYSPERLEGAIVYGFAGWVAGGLAGMGIGSALWRGAEGNWAGAAIGAGVGLVIGNLIGVLYPPHLLVNEEGDVRGGGAGYPIMLSIPIR